MKGEGVFFESEKDKAEKGFSALSFSDSKKVPIYCLVDRNRFPVVSTPGGFRTRDLWHNDRASYPSLLYRHSLCQKEHKKLRKHINIYVSILHSFCLYLFIF